MTIVLREKDRPPKKRAMSKTKKWKHNEVTPDPPGKKTKWTKTKYEVDAENTNIIGA